jgi:hypothetical protein
MDHDEQLGDPSSSAYSVSEWRAEIGSDASMGLRAKLRLYADRVREDTDREQEERPRP